MKYLVEMGYSGAAVVECDRDDLNGMTAAAIRMGVGDFIPFDEMMEDYEEDCKDGDSWASDCESIYEYAEQSEWYYNENLNGFVYLNRFWWEPVPPNVQVGPVNYGEDLKRSRFLNRPRARA